MRISKKYFWNIRKRLVWGRLLQLVLVIALCATTLSVNTGVATAAVPLGFEDTFVASVSGPIDMVWTPDGRMIIINKNGLVKVYASGALLSTPALDLSARLCTVGEQGLVGIALHPNFASNHYVYLYYIYNKFNNACPENEVDGPVGRFSRFVLSNSNLIDPASEVILFETSPRYRNHHTGGDPKFGKDGYLYIPIGDAGGQSLAWPQDLGTLHGKVLRITDTGGIPPDNPYMGIGTARCNVGGVPPAGSPAGTKCQEIYSAGLRNPFRFAMDPNAAGVHYYIDDVGQHTWEEISEGPIVGGNYGWQVREGPCAKDSDTDCGLPPAGMNDPIHWYHHGPDGGAATGATFIPNGVWPAAYDGKYLFADYVFGKIYMLEPGGPNCRLCAPPTSMFNQVEFATIAQVVSLRFGPYGAGQALYYATRDGSEIRRITFTGSSNRSPLAVATANPTSGPVPLNVQFNGSGSSDPDGDVISYEWDFENDGTPDSTLVAPTHQYATPGVYTSKLTVRDGHGGENSTTISIDAGNTPPVPTIDTPVNGALFAVGNHFILHGHASDTQDGTIPDSSLTWQVLKHHATHTHPFLEPTTGNDLEIIAPEPEDLDAASTSYLEIRLTATDSNGLSQTVSRDLRPKFVDITFQTNPPGLKLNISGGTFTGPSTVHSWQGFNLAVNAANQTDSSGAHWVFSSWSDGGSAAHNITTPASASTYTATFTKSSPPIGDRDTTGVFRPSNGLLFLKNKNETGFADAALNYGLPGDYPVVGDWDGNGTVTIGIYRHGYFYLKNANTLGFADIVFPFGQPGDQPIAGDWNGDGVDTIGVYRTSNGQFLLRNSNDEGSAETSFFLGNPGDVGVAGDWTGKGFDTTGVFRPSNGVIFLKNSNNTGFADIALNYGLPGDQPVMGDWDNDGKDTIGIYRLGTFYLRNENTNGFATIVFGLGNPGDMPVAGDWDALP